MLLCGNKVVKENSYVYISESSDASVIDAVYINPGQHGSELYDANKNKNESEKNTLKASARINGTVTGLDHPVSEHESENYTEILDQNYARQVSFLKRNSASGKEVEDKTTNVHRSEFNLQKKDAVKENVMLLGDNMRLYLNDDRQIVQKYRDEYFKKVEEAMNSEKESIKDVSLKSLGGQVLTSKVYRIQSLSGSKKRRKKFGKLDSGMIDNDIKGEDVENELSLSLNIPEEVGVLDITM